MSQSLLILDDQQKIYLLNNEENVRFSVIKVIDFSHHGKLQSINSLRDRDWTSLNVSER